MYHFFFIHSSLNGHLGCFHVLAIVNSAAVNIGVHVSFSILIFFKIDLISSEVLISVSSGYVPSTGIAGSYGGFIPFFFF